MTLGRPIGNIPGTPRTHQEHAADLHRLQRIQEFLPDDLVRPAVVAFYKGQTCKSLEQALGDPVDVLRCLDVDPKLQATLRGVIADEVPAPEGKIVDEEVRTARQELTRYWVDCMMTAWEAFEQPEIVLGAGTLLPNKQVLDAKLHPTWEAWDASRRESLDSLLTSIAVERDDMLGLTKGFACNVGKELAHHTKLELPDRLELRSKAKAVVLGPR